MKNIAIYIFLTVPFFTSSQYYKDTLHCGCIYKLKYKSKDILGQTVYIGEVVYDVNGDLSESPGYEKFYSAVPTELPKPKSIPELIRVAPPKKNPNSIWKNYNYGDGETWF